MPTLYLVCHACHKEFPSTISVADPPAKDVLMSSDRQKCPHCGVESEYFTHEYHLPHVAEPAADAKESGKPSPEGEAAASRSDVPTEVASGDVEALAHPRGQRKVIR
jgi:hypothetical protein